MLERGLCIVATLLIGLAAGGAVADDDVDSICPPNLRAWRTSGDAAAGGEWSARFLEIRGDVGMLRELVLRFGDGSLPPDEARWFDAPGVLEPIGLHTRTLSFVDRAMASVCRHLSDAQISELREKAKPKCYVGSEGNRMLVKSRITLSDSGLESSWQYSSDGVGLAVAEDINLEEDDLPCEPLENLEANLEGIEDSQLGAGAVEAVEAILDELDERDSPLEAGLAALPPARHVLSVLRQHDGDRVPEDLPSEFYLTATTAPDQYAEALALERMLTAEDTDEAVALKLLGDRASATAVPLLRLKLHTSIAADRGPIVSLTLRALLAADPHVARLEAVPLLTNPSFARAALGVFALTDPDLQEVLESLDAADGDAVRDAGLRVLTHLEATADDDLQQAVRELQRESDD
jgi:hypothetical protein